MTNVSFEVDIAEPTAMLVEKISNTSAPVLAKWMATRAIPWLADRAEARFDEEGDDASGPWPPLAYPTQQIRSFEGYGATGPINVRTGELQDYVVGSAGDIRATSYTASLKWPDATAGELTRKMISAQRGRKSPPTPPRPVVAFSEVDRSNLISSLQDWVNAGNWHLEAA